MHDILLNFNIGIIRVLDNIQFDQQHSSQIYFSCLIGHNRHNMCDQLV